MAADPEGAKETPEGAPPAAEGDVTAANERLAAELRRRGVPETEVARLIGLGSPAVPPGPALPVTGAAEAAPARPAPFTAHPTVAFPDFRDTSSEEREEAGRLLSAAHLARRRGEFQQAERLCREALERAPSDAVALELYGDVLQALGRVDDALAAYERATKADATRPVPARKHAELLLLQDHSVEALRHQVIPRSPLVAALLSTICPGAGQFYNGEAGKGLVFALVGLVCVLTVFWSPWGWSALQGLSVPTAVALVVLAVVWICAIVDASRGASQRPRRSGWEV